MHLSIHPVFIVSAPAPSRQGSGVSLQEQSLALPRGAGSAARGFSSSLFPLSEGDRWSRREVQVPLHLLKSGGLREELTPEGGVMDVVRPCVTSNKGRWSGWNAGGQQPPAAGLG